MTNKGAEFSPCRKYRYRLWRRWNDNKDYLTWLLLNPSTADASIDDPTIRRCMNYAYHWKYGGIHVINLFALRATDPRELKRARDPIGDVNDSIIQSYSNHDIIAGWGNHGSYLDRAKHVIELLNCPIWCLKVTKGGHPQHPLYLSKALKPIRYRGYNE